MSGALNQQPAALTPDAPIINVGYMNQSAAEKPQGFLRDMGDEAWNGLLRMGTGALGLASFATRQISGNPEAVEHIENTRRALEDHIQSTIESMSPKQQVATHASLFHGGETDANGQRIPTVGEAGYARYMATQAASFAPTLALAFLPGGLIGRAVTALGFGSMQGGDAYNAMVDQLDRAKPEEMMGSPAYRALRDQGLDDIAAKQTLLGKVAPGYVAAQFGVGAVFGGLLPSVLHGAGTVGMGMGKRAALGAAEGAGLMGAQSGAGGALEQSANMGMGTQKEFDPEKLALDVASGALGGLVMGGAFGALPHKAPKTPTPEPKPTPPGISPEVHTALQGALDLGQAPPGFNAGAQQGELFRPIDQANTPAPPPPPPAPPPAPPQNVTPPPAPAGSPAQPDLLTPPAAQTAPPVPRPSDGMSRKDLVDALSTMPGMDPKIVRRMSASDLQARFDTAQHAQSLPPAVPAPAAPQAGAANLKEALDRFAALTENTQTGTPVAPTAPEPQRDLDAQFNALKDPANPKDAHLLRPGDKVPAIPKGSGIQIVSRPEGRLLTTNKDKAALFRNGPVTDELMAHVLGYPETKAQAEASGQPAVVQALDQKGNVVHEMAASPEGVPAAQAIAAAHAPGGTTQVTTPEAVIDRRMKEVASEPRAPADISGLRKARDQAKEAAKEAATRYAHDQSQANKERRDQTWATFEVTRTALLDAMDVHPVEKAAAAVQEPTPAQAEAGNYKKGHLALHGLDVTIETPRGGTRRGPGWETTMPAHYGYVKGTKGRDGDQVDVTLGSRTPAMFDGKPSEAASQPVFIVDQIDPVTGKFDEHKAFLGFHTQLEAQATYDASFSDGSGPRRRGAVTEMPFADFKDWLNSKDTTKPLAYQPKTRAEVLKAHRALEKAKLFTQPGERMQGEGFVAPATRGTREQMKQVANTPPGLAMLLTKRAEPKRADASDIAAAINEDTARGGGRAADTGIAEEGSEISRPSGNLVASYEGGRNERAEGSAQTRKIDDLLHEVVEGNMTPAEADEAYGRQAPGAGRKRQFADLKSYVEQLIAHGENPENLNLLLRNAAKREADKTLTSDQKAVITKEGQRLMELTDPDYIQRLKDIRDELAEAPKTEPKKIAAPERASLAADKVKQLTASEKLKAFNTANKKRLDTGAYRRALKDPRISTAVTNLLGRGARSIHDYLDAISSSLSIQATLPGYTELARRLKAALPRDLQVMTHAEAMAKYPDLEAAWGPEELSAAGIYWPRTDERPPIIALKEGANVSHAETALHEAVHAATFEYIERLTEGDLPEHQNKLRALDAISDELRRAADDRGILEKLFNKEDIHDQNYALSDPHELVAMLMTNPAAQELAARTKPSAEFVAKMKELGYGDIAPKSLWQAFTGFIRKMLGLKGDPTVLDYAMRPLQDVIDNGAAFDRLIRGAEREGKLRPDKDDVKNLATKVVDKIDPKGLSDSNRRFWLNFATLDGMVTWYKQRFQDGKQNHLENYRAATEKIARASQELHDKWDDRVRDLGARLSTKDSHAVRDLAVETNYLNATLLSDKATANDHLTKPEDLARLANLQKQFKALTPEQQKLYRDQAAMHRALHIEEQQAGVRGAIRMVLPHLADKQTELFAKVMKDDETRKAFLKDPDASEIAASFGADWVKDKDLAKAIGKFYEAGQVRGDYVPLRRFGDYVVRWGDREDKENYGAAHFERRSEAESFREDMIKKQGADSVQQVVDKNEPHSGAKMSDGMVDDFMRAVEARPELKDNAEKIRDLLTGIRLQHATRSAAARAQQKREGIRGASTDLARVLAKDFLATASRVGYLEHAPERSEAMNRMEMHEKSLAIRGKPGDAIEARAVINELKQRNPIDGDSSSVLTGLGRRMTNMGFIYSLMSPSMMVVHTAEAHMNSLPRLTSRHGAKAVWALAKAGRQIAPSLASRTARTMVSTFSRELATADWNLSNVIRDRLVTAGADKTQMHALFNALNSAMLIDHSQTREMRRMADPSWAITRGRWQRFLDFNMAATHAVDSVNKGVIAKAAFDLEMAKNGGNVEQAARYAVEEVRGSLPNYNFHNKNRISTPQGVLGPLAPVVSQFKQYGYFMYNMMGGLAHQAMKSEDPTARKEAAWALAGVLASHAVVAGILSNPFMDAFHVAAGVYDWAIGDKQPHDFDNDIRSWLAEMVGPGAAEVVSRGLPHAVGFDLHRRVGLGNLLEMPQIEAFDKAHFLGAIGSVFTGASGEDALQIGQSVKDLANGDWKKGIQNMVPRVIRDPMKAYDLANRGVVDSKGKTVLSPDLLSSGDIAYQALGFQPSRVTEFREGKQAVIEARQESRDAHQRVMDQVLRADPDDRADAMLEVQAYNANNPENRVTYAQILQAMQRQKNQAKASSVGAFGLTLPKKQARSLAQAGAFANY